SVQPDAHEIKPSDALSDDEVAKLAEEFVSDETAKEEGHGDAHEAPTLTDKNSEVREAKNNSHSEEADDHSAKPAKKEKAATQNTSTTTSARAVQPMKAATSVAHNENPEHVEKPKTTQTRLPSSLPKQL